MDKKLTMLMILDGFGVSLKPDEFSKIVNYDA